jgi:hypothetical protein
LAYNAPSCSGTIFNEKDKIPPIDEGTQATFDQGHEVGEWAKKRYPDGIEVPFGDFKGTIEKTKELVAQRKVIFEASFLFENCYSRADILVPVDDDQWDVIEVKSATKVKDENIEDVAFQRFVMEGCGLKIRRCHLMFINNEYIRQGDIDPRQLLTMDDITEDVDLKLSLVMENVAEMWNVINGAKPDIKIGCQCNEPYDCDLKSICWAHLPENNVTQLYWAGKKAFPLIDAGYEAIADVPADKLSDKQKIQQETVISGKTHIEATPIKDWLSHLGYPLFHFDFETVAPAVPLFDGTRPFQQVPFQFSLHIQQKDGSVEHIEFLHTEFSDPRPSLIKAMKAIGPKGTILAFNMGFEKGRIREMAEAFPNEKEFLLGLNDRMDDLIIPFKNFWIHDVKQHGSNSIKAVLPAFTTTSYDGMVICKGDQASREWLRVVKGAEDKEAVFEELRKYCQQDTQAMIDVLECIRLLI